MLWEEMRGKEHQVDTAYVQERVILRREVRPGSCMAEGFSCHPTMVKETSADLAPPTLSPTSELSPTRISAGLAPFAGGKTAAAGHGKRE